MILLWVLDPKEKTLLASIALTGEDRGALETEAVEWLGRNAAED
jgi:hypothetical protein